MSDEIKFEPIPNNRRKVFFGLFVFPMLIAVTMAILLSGIVLLTHEDETPESLITAIKTGAPSKRWQKAYELSNELNREGGMIRSAGIMNEIIHILNDEEHYDTKTRAYMAMALGRFKNEEAYRALLSALNKLEDQHDPQLALFMMWSLGNLSPHLSPPPQGGRKMFNDGDFPSPFMGEGQDGGAIQGVARFLNSEHDDLRKTAAYVLGVFGDKQVISQLQHSLEDAVVDVRWNAALSLARLGDESGKEILFQMLDRDHLRSAYQLEDSAIEQVMVNAAKALNLIFDGQAKALLEKISRTDPSLKVREAALNSLNQTI